MAELAVESGQGKIIFGSLSRVTGWRVGRPSVILGTPER